MADEPELAICARLEAMMFTASDEAALQDHNTTREAAAIIKELVKAAERGLEAVIECANEWGEKDDVFGNYMKDIRFIEAALKRAGANNDPSK